jgi:hypothetical protein
VDRTKVALRVKGCRWRTRSITSCVLVLLLAALCGCGSTTAAITSAQSAASATAFAAAAMPVSLHLNTGSYSLSAPTATIAGTVTRGASVRVNGRVARVRSGRWTWTLALHVGRNRIVVLATMHGRSPHRKSIEITRRRSAAERQARAVEAEQRKATEATEATERKAAEEAAKQKAAAEQTPVCTNGTYVNSAGNTVCSPEESPTAPAGATAECRDGTYSFSQSRSGTCSHHGGVARWL